MLHDSYLTVREFALKFKVSTTLVYKLIKSGEIPAVNLGGKNYRISSRTVEGIESTGLFN